MIILEFHCNSVQLLGGYIRFYAVLYAPVLPREKKMFLALGLTIVLPDTATLGKWLLHSRCYLEQGHL